MKYFPALLFHLVTAQLLHGFSDETPQIFPCLNAKQQSVGNECESLIKEMASMSYIQSMSDCIDETEVEGTEDSSIKKICEARFIRDSFISYTDCYFLKIGLNSIDTDPIDLKSFKAATIEASTLNDSDKIAASADFDACIAANYSLPFVHFSFRSEQIPESLRNYTSEYNRAFKFGEMAPTSAIVAFECMISVLVQNNCTPTPESADVLTRQIPFPKKDYMEDKLMRCMNEDYNWFNEICGGLTASYLTTIWVQNCSRANEPQRRATTQLQMQGEVDMNTSCRVGRMRQIREFTSDCLMHKYKSVGDPLLYKEVVVGQSKLSDQRKAAAKASFDLCMAQNLTLPYRMFPHDLETIPGRPIFKAIAALCNAIFSIGHQSPTLQMRAVDCASAALTLNGCDEKTSTKTAMKAFRNLIGVDQDLEVLNFF